MVKCEGSNVYPPVDQMGEVPTLLHWYLSEGECRGMKLEARGVESDGTWVEHQYGIYDRKPQRNTEEADPRTRNPRS